MRSENHKNYGLPQRVTNGDIHTVYGCTFDVRSTSKATLNMPTASINCLIYMITKLVLLVTYLLFSKQYHTKNKQSC